MAFFQVCLVACTRLLFSKLNIASFTFSLSGLQAQTHKVFAGCLRLFLSALPKSLGLGSHFVMAACPPQPSAALGTSCVFLFGGRAAVLPL